MSDNLSLWSKVSKTNPKHTKQVPQGGGRKLTAIDAQYQIQEATRVFGPMGIGWGVKNQSFDVFKANPNDHREDLYIYNGTLWYKYEGEYGEMELASEIPVYTKKIDKSTREVSYYQNSDIRKKVSTDALTKGLSRLGFSADVFLGLFDDNKYTMELNKEFKEKEVVHYDKEAKVQAMASPEDKRKMIVASIGEQGKRLMTEFGIDKETISGFMSKVSDKEDWRQETDSKLSKIETIMKKVVALNQANKLYQQYTDSKPDEKFLNHVNATMKKLLKSEVIETGFSNNPSLNNDVTLASIVEFQGVIEGFLG